MVKIIVSSCVPLAPPLHRDPCTEICAACSPGAVTPKPSLGQQWRSPETPQLIRLTNAGESQSMNTWPIGVFTSIDEGLGVQWDVLHELEIATVHLHAPSQAWRSPDRARELQRKLQEMGIRSRPSSAGLPARATPISPRHKRRSGWCRWRLEPPASPKCRRLFSSRRSSVVRSPRCIWDSFVGRKTIRKITTRSWRSLGTLCDGCHRRDMALHLETGQETVDHLIQFLDDVARSNLFVNFDPANMILYGTGEPVAAARQLGSRIRSVHCKDAKWAAHPGLEWGQETPLARRRRLGGLSADVAAIGYFGSPYDRARDPAPSRTTVGRNWWRRPPADSASAGDPGPSLSIERNRVRAPRS